MHKHKNYRY